MGGSRKELPRGLYMDKEEVYKAIKRRQIEDNLKTISKDMKEMRNNQA